MSVETENQARNLQYAWLESAEEKLTSVFEDLHGVCLGIIEECFKTFNATHIELCCSCKRSKISSNVHFAKDGAWHGSRFSLAIQTWKDKFLRLKKRYRRLRRGDDPAGKFLIDKAANSSEKFPREKTRDYERSVRIESRRISGSAEDLEESGSVCETNSLQTCHLSDLVILDGDEPEQKNGPSKSDFVDGECLSKVNSFQSPDTVSSRQKDRSSYISEREEKENESVSFKETSLKDGCKRSSRCPTSPAWKSASRNLLRSKHNFKVRYLDSSMVASANKSINEFFKPRVATRVRSITPRRLKRQMANSSVELPELKRTKEERTRSENDAGVTKENDHPRIDVVDEVRIGSTSHTNCSKVKESILDCVNLDIVKKPITVDSAGEIAHRKSIDSGKRGRFDEVDYDGHFIEIGKDILRHSCKRSGDDAETRSFRDSGERGPLRSSKSSAGKGSGKQVQYFASEKQDDADVDVTCWGLDENVGLPSLASTPMVHKEDVRKVCQNGKDFDDTIWSAPASPSVVRSILSSPDTAAEKEANSPREMSPFLIPDRDAMPLILRDSQSPATDISRESDLKRRRGNNQTFKTSEADLSADMFFGNTENFDHTQEENVQKRNIKRRESLAEKMGVSEEKKHDKQEAIDNESFESLKQRKKVDVKYKYSSVVRKRDERDKLDGFACAECEAWYQDEKDCEEKRKHLQNVCRHKAVSSPPPSTPDGFWSIGFLDTPVYMNKGLMLDEDDTLPPYARPKKRKERNEKRKEKEEVTEE